jgi:hypothetical protein
MGSEDEIIQRVRAALARGDLQELGGLLYEYAADDFTDEWPQSGELIRGRENMKAINESYPAGPGGGPPQFQMRRIVEPGQAWVVEGTINYGDGTPVSYVGIFETKDGKIRRATEYFADPFEAPAWRSQWVERTEREREPAGAA